MTVSALAHWSNRGDHRLITLSSLARERYVSNDPGHDWSHIERVIQNCFELGQAANADFNILLPAALLHDLANPPKHGAERTRAGIDSASQGEALLRVAEYLPTEIARVKKIIEEHSYSRGISPSCLESAVLQDADRLDSLGAIGIFRAVTCGCRLGSAYYHKADPFARNRTLNDTCYVLDHFFAKLLRLSESLNTEPARQEALRRVAFMRSFLRQLETEIGHGL